MRSYFDTSNGFHMKSEDMSAMSGTLRLTGTELRFTCGDES